MIHLLVAWLLAPVMAPTPLATEVSKNGDVRLRAKSDVSNVLIMGRIRDDSAHEVQAAPPLGAARNPAATPVVARRLVPLPCYQPGAVVCGKDAQVCQPATDGAPRTLYWIFTGPPGVARPAEEQWQLTASACFSPAEAAAAVPGAAVPVLTAEQFRRLPLPAGDVRIQPGNGRTLVNVPTNVYVVARVAVIPTTVIGRQVQVRATPTAYDWTFGDGQHLHTADPGAPDPDLRPTHTYRAPGTQRLALTTTYRGEYSVDGGPWLPVDGTAAVVSPSQDLLVVAARSELVADPLPS